MATNQVSDDALDIELKNFRATFRKWVKDKLVPNYRRWEKEGCVPRQVWEDAGDMGFLCPTISEENGGLGLDFRFAHVMIEEMGRACVTAPAFRLHSDVLAKCIEDMGSTEQKRRWLPGMISGRVIAASAMTEPDAGSDLMGIKTRAKRNESGWILNGQKTFITHGALCDLVFVLARTGSADTAPMRSLSLFLVDASTPGFSRGPALEKIGMRALDTTELFFEDCPLPEEALIGNVGDGMTLSMLQMTDERLNIGLDCVASAQAALTLACEYAHERKIQGKPLVHFQDVRFKIAEMSADVAAGQALANQTLEKLRSGWVRPDEAALLKYWASEMLERVVDKALGLHGGYGCMQEYPISRLYTDARIRRIYGGTNEIMKEIIARRHVRMRKMGD